MAIHKVMFLNELCTVKFSKYHDGNTCIDLICENGEPMARCTVLVNGYPMAKDTVLIKDYSENEGILRGLEAAGVVRDTGMRVRSGYVEIPVCKLLIEV
jgi:hypothetical protein